MKSNHILSGTVFVLSLTILSVCIFFLSCSKSKTDDCLLTISENDLYKIDFTCNPINMGKIIKKSKQLKAE